MDLLDWIGPRADLDVERAPELPDVAEQRPRSASLILRPRTTEAVRVIVMGANATGLRLHPFSTGRTWGLGSRKPVTDGCILVDLGRLRTIRKLDLEQGYAIVETGVTQGDLSDRLLGTPFFLDVTTSCRDTSVIGNTLDRGDATFRPRADDLLGLEAVLGDGELITTGGCGPADERRYHQRCGPDLSPLFLQSNFGIVTAGVVTLLARPECTRVFHARFEGHALASVVDALARLERQRVLPSIFRLTELALRPSGASEPPGFAVLGPLSGKRRLVDAIESLLRDEVGSLPGCTAVRTQDAREVVAGDPLYHPAQTFLGIPHCEGIRARFGTTTCDLDVESPNGWSAFLVGASWNGEHASACIDAVRLAVAEHMLTVNVHVSLWQRSLAALVMIWFPRDDAGIARARSMRSSLLAELKKRGLQLLRVGVDEQHEVLLDAGPAHLDGLWRLKQSLDPGLVMAPGRYVPERSPSR